MGKNGKSSSGKTYTSKNERQNVSNSTRKRMKSAKSTADKIIDKQSAWLKGKNPWITIENPNKNETNKRFIKVRMNDVNGTAKDREKRMFIMK